MIQNSSSVGICSIIFPSGVQTHFNFAGGMEDVGTPGKVTSNGTRTAVVATYFVRPQPGGLSISLVCSSQSEIHIKQQKNSAVQTAATISGKY